MCKCRTESTFFLKIDDKSYGSVTNTNFYTILWSGIFSIIFTVASSVFEGDVFLEVFVRFLYQVVDLKSQFVSEFSL